MESHLLNLFHQWKQYSMLPFIDTISGHDIAAETLIIVIDGNCPHDTSSMELYLADSGNDSWFEINDLNNDSMQHLTPITQIDNDYGITIYKINKIMPDLAEILPKIVLDSHKLVNVNIYINHKKDEYELPLAFIQFYLQHYVILSKFVPHNFNIFYEQEIQSELTAGAFFVQHWFVFARQNCNLLAVNCQLNSDEYGDCLILNSEQRNCCVYSMISCTIDELTRMIANAGDGADLDRITQEYFDL